MELQVEVDAIKQNLLANHNHMVYITLKQAQFLASLINEGLVVKRRRLRIRVLNILVGDAMKQIAGIEEIQSTKNLTAPVASYLIDLLQDKDGDEWGGLSDYGRELISQAESVVEAQIDGGEI
jgi:hypothetical protein